MDIALIQSYYHIDYFSLTYRQSRALLNRLKDVIDMGNGGTDPQTWASRVSDRRENNTV